MSGGVWMASYAALWIAVGVLLVMVLALVRQIGVLHGRLDDVGPGGEVEDDDADAGSVEAVGVRRGGGDAGPRAAGANGHSGAGAGAAGRAPVGQPLAAAEGPPLGSMAPMGARVGFERSPLTLVAFTSASCELSQVLVPALRIVDKQYGDVRVVELALGPRTIAAFEAFNVLHTPFVVAVGQDGRVRGRGRARNLQQLEAFVERALAVAAKAAGRAAGGSAAASAAGVAPAPAVADDARPPVATSPDADASPAPESEAPVDAAPAVVDGPAADAEPVVDLDAPQPTADDAARAGV